MIPEILSSYLEHVEWGGFSFAEVSLIPKIRETLTSFAGGELSETALEKFLLEKLEGAQSNLERIETMEYPMVVANYHVALHSAFVNYEEGLATLEQFLWEDAEWPLDSLNEIVAQLLEGDRALKVFQNQLEDDLAPLAGVDLLW